MPAASDVHVVIGMTGLTTQSGGFTIKQDRVLSFPVPRDFASSHCAVARRDFELLAEIAGKESESLGRLHKAAIENDPATATRIANEIGLTEERFVAEGGGVWTAMIVLAAVGLAYAAATSGGSSEPVSGPSQPPPEETVLGPSSAGSAGGT
ncbi:MAG: hypothetical protein QOJ89_5064 [bacterium]|jgi:hypothetical protein